jgi:hypothetical protein
MSAASVLRPTAEQLDEIVGAPLYELVVIKLETANEKNKYQRKE